jgi:acetyl-CoA carboxylase carboxyltransferase component
LRTSGREADAKTHRTPKALHAKFVEILLLFRGNLFSLFESALSVQFVVYPCEYSPPAGRRDGFACASLIPAPSRIKRVRVMSRTSASSSGELLRAHCAAIAKEEAVLREGGGKAGHERQRKMNRLPVRERLSRLLDKESPFFEIGLWAAYKMYEQWGKIPAAGVVAGIGNVEGVPCMIVANDATVKAGAFFPQTTKKVIRAQRLAFECSLPIIYLVDSAGVFLPMQDEIFPDEDDFGRIFRNNSVISAAGIPQFAAIMGNCVAGGAYLPVLCDKILMTKGSGLYLAGPSLVKAAIGQVVDAEELGGAQMHAEISGTVDFFEKDDSSCLKRLRSLVALLPEARSSGATDASPARTGRALPKAFKPAKDPDSVYDLISFDGQKQYDVRDLLATVIDEHSMDEYKADYGKTIVTAYARISGRPVGIVANQRLQVRTKKEGIQMGGVIYSDSADKAARFIMDCNQTSLPIIFFQDVTGFMVGRDAEQSGIIRSGAKLVSAVSNSIVPKITVVVGGSFGAGNYAMCGKAYDPRFIVAWPTARYAVMGAAQASDTVFSILARARERGDKKSTHEELEELRIKVKQSYEEQTDIRYGAARGWVDAIIQPNETRDILIRLLQYVTRPKSEARFHTGVIQV